MWAGRGQRVFHAVGGVGGGGVALWVPPSPARRPEPATLHCFRASLHGCWRQLEGSRDMPLPLTCAPDGDGKHHAAVRQVVAAVCER